MASAALGAVTVGLRLPSGHRYKVPGYKRISNEVTSGGLSVDTLGYLIGTSEEPFPVLPDTPSLSQELGPDSPSYHEASKDVNLLHAHVTSVPLGPHPKPKRFNPPAEWPGKVWTVLNNLQANRDMVEWEFQMTNWSQPPGSAPWPGNLDKTFASASTSKPQSDVFPDSMEGLGESSAVWSRVNQSDTKFSKSESSHGADKEIPQMLYAREETMEEMMAANLTMAEVHDTMDESTAKQETLATATRTPPPTFPASNIHLMSSYGGRSCTPTSTRSMAPTGRSRSSCSRTNPDFSKMLGALPTKAALDHALKLSVWHDHQDRVGAPGSRSFRYMRGPDIDERIKAAEDEVKSWHEQGAVPSPGCASLAEDTWPPPPREPTSKTKNKGSIWRQVPVARRNPKMAYKEWQRRENLKQHIEDMKKAGSDRALTGSLWLFARENVKSGYQERDPENDWAKTDVCFDLLAHELMWEKPSQMQRAKDDDAWAHLYLHDKHSQSDKPFDFTTMPPVKQKKRTLYPFQITKPTVVSHNHKKEQNHRIAFTGPSVTLATETTEERQQWMEALKQCREGRTAQARSVVKHIDKTISRLDKPRKTLTG